ncbi:uncharacterized protein BCR38DRAFT_412381 [Pseudomassariella vexata]|uniref:Uncharacterized protein n=1 Tax=Pseudomassariella vexata TaxID=1141098 RepID=A0A1Y2DM16_9PEZI|nr:uncharacterized protein BCR38DRAFT_412381 [Pseudomassariella vexata]ORY60194.1 hypothetical protein BCR38DRAFT_412381 [Pseudomassariella vexata]
MQFHEQSICKARRSTFFLPPPGNVLSSSGPERRIIAANTFPCIAELEQRERRIEFILRSDFIEVSGPPGIGTLTVRQQERLVSLLRRALYHCDRIADIAANVPQAEMPEQYYDLISCSVWEVGTGLPTTLRNFDPFTNIRAREPQIEYIKSLSLEDLVGLFYTFSVAGMGFLRARQYDTSDPEVFEKITVFEESLLRHGTWFLWSLQNNGKGGIGVDTTNITTATTTTAGKDGKESANYMVMQEIAGHMLSAGLVELRDWETGKNRNGPRGLRMSVLTAAEEKMVGERKESSSHDTITIPFDSSRGFYEGICWRSPLYHGVCEMNYTNVIEPPNKPSSPMDSLQLQSCDRKGSTLSLRQS